MDAAVALAGHDRIESSMIADPIDAPSDGDHSDEPELEETESSTVAEEEPHKPRSGAHLWGIAAVAGTFIGTTMLRAAGGGADVVDEDDALAAVAFFQGSGASGSTSGASAAGAGGSGAGTSAGATGAAGGGAGGAAGGGAGGGAAGGGAGGNGGAAGSSAQ